MSTTKSVNPQISNKMDDIDILRFTLSGVNVSIANAIRRTILSDIPIIVFKTTPQEENMANFVANTSRMNNEILKQRLGCIPIYLDNLKIRNIDDYILEVNVENNTDDSIIYVTTKDFKIRNISENRLLDEASQKIVFPPWNSPTGEEYYIEFARLRPKISDTIPGEKLHFTCKFSHSNAKENAMYNCVSACSYGFTPDTSKQLEEVEKKKKDWGELKLDIHFEEKNWYLLEGQRIVLENSFDFIIQTIGVYSNTEIIDKACENIVSRLKKTSESFDINENYIIESENTMDNSYDIILENEDYTIGKVIEYMLYSRLYETNILSFCGFKKYHPHNTDSLIRIAYNESTTIPMVKQNVQQCITESIEIFNKIKILFYKK